MTHASRAILRAAAVGIPFVALACGHDTIYQCEGGAVVNAHFGGKAVRLELPDTTVMLPKVGTGDSARYGNDTYIFWPRPAGALVQRGDLIIYRGCINTG